MYIYTLLHVSYAKMRTIYGQQRINEPSEFLRDLPDTILEYETSSYSGGTSMYSENETYIDDDGDEQTSYLSF